MHVISVTDTAFIFSTSFCYLEGKFKAWEGRLQALDGRFQAWEGRFQARESLGGTDGQTDKRKSPCALQDFVPFGAAALLPLTEIHNHAKQGNGYRWPHIALGRPVEHTAPAQMP